ncbi:hypothetical protein OUZ56_008098 [Daphnia magna]|uniref:Uncharacterized protein n=1 Tax=Daphnia magna TaxID=35525 RepID=A0ABR0ABY3_9CRUS|nr:hypothetical protein OUZ56_008098 [Daphnia magna]
MKRPASEVLYAYTLLQQPLAIMDVMQVEVEEDKKGRGYGFGVNNPFVLNQTKTSASHGIPPLLQT